MAELQDQQFKEHRLKIVNDLRKYKLAVLGMMIAYIFTVFLMGFMNSYRVFQINNVVGANDNKMTIRTICLLGAKSILKNNLSKLIFTDGLFEILENDEGFRIDDPEIIKADQIGKNSCRVIIKDKENEKIKSYKFKLRKKSNFAFNFKINQIDEQHYYQTLEE